MKVLGKVIDERFLDRRLRSSSTAGIAGGILAVLLFEYRFLIEHKWSWDLLAVGITIAAVKLGLMTWYSFTD